VPYCKNGMENETAPRDLIGAPHLVHIFVLGIVWHKDALLTPNARGERPLPAGQMERPSVARTGGQRGAETRGGGWLDRSR